MPQQRPLTVPLFLLGILLLSASLGCEETGTSPKRVAADTSETTAADLDLQVTMDELAAVLEKRSEWLQKLLRDPQAFTRYHADLVSQTFYDDNRLVDMINDKMQAGPSSITLICSSYAETARAASSQAVHDYAAVRNSKQCGPDLAAKIYKSDYSQRAREGEIGMMYMMMAQGSRRYWEKFPEFRDQDLQNASSLEILCIRARLIEESFSPAK
jgi:hypothetical protein